MKTSVFQNLKNNLQGSWVNLLFNKCLLRFLRSDKHSASYQGYRDKHNRSPLKKRINCGGGGEGMILHNLRSGKLASGKSQ